MNNWISKDGRVTGAIIDGEERSFSDLTEISGIKDTTLRSRANAGWTLDQALTMTPLRTRKVVVGGKENEMVKQCSKVASMKWV